MIRVIIAIWNKNHMALPELGVCPRGVRSMPINDARSMLINDPGFWRQRAEEARRLAARMTDEMAKQDDAHGRGRVRQVCYRGGHVLHLRVCPQFPPDQERRLA